MKLKNEKKLNEFEFQCSKCKKIHEKAYYAIAQLAQGHKIKFTCDCGHKMILTK